jgi:ABC-type spermidine/putrescine transport system permease subunit II
MARFDPDMVKYENAARALGAGEWERIQEDNLPTDSSTSDIGVFLLIHPIARRTSTNIIRNRGHRIDTTYIYNQMSVTAPTPTWFALGSITTVVSFIVLMTIAIFLTREIRRVV